MAFTLDTANEFEARALDRLTNEQVGWLTTVSGSEFPQPNPIWFFWDGNSIIIFSMNNAARGANIKSNPNVSFNFNSTEYGGDVVVILGTAAFIDRSAVPVEIVDRLLAKYDGGLKSIDMTGPQYLRDYGETIRITPIRVRGG